MCVCGMTLLSHLVTGCLFGTGQGGEVTHGKQWVLRDVIEHKVVGVALAYLRDIFNPPSTLLNVSTIGPSGEVTVDCGNQVMCY